MSKKINVGILFGGKSVEHEVSLRSGISVARVIDRNRYVVHFIGIDKQGEWNQYDIDNPVEYEDDPYAIRLGAKGRPIDFFSLKEFDVIFPTLHGSLGEDGTVQGLLRLAEVPFVGSGVLGSAVGMDKDFAKRLVAHANISTAPYQVLDKNSCFDFKNLKFPLFVKPANTGSSIGITRVCKPEEFFFAAERAFCYDDKVLLEEEIKGREIQVGVMGNQKIKASLPCEIIPKKGFHSYESKYTEKNAAKILYPASLTEDQVQKVQDLALEVYRILACEGFGRVDFFLSTDGTFYFNEINTIPGLTSISSYAKMWEISGTPYVRLIDQLMDLAIERHQIKMSLTTSLKVLASL